MKKTLHIDDKLLKEARASARVGSDTETVQRGLEALLRDAAYQRLRALRGSEPATSLPRRRGNESRKGLTASLAGRRKRKAA
jgi:Arc/MetJ family transcription regulator